MGLSELEDRPWSRFCNESLPNGAVCVAPWLHAGPHMDSQRCFHERRDYMNEIKTGNTVRLKSGGPVMTVRNRTGPPMVKFDNPITCDWFGGEFQSLNTKTFEEDQLTVVGGETA